MIIIKTKAKAISIILCFVSSWRRFDGFSLLPRGNFWMPNSFEDSKTNQKIKQTRKNQIIDEEKKSFFSLFSIQRNFFSKALSLCVKSLMEKFAADCSCNRIKRCCVGNTRKSLLKLFPFDVKSQEGDDEETLTINCKWELDGATSCHDNNK